jgi:hypothetical protein
MPRTKTIEVDGARYRIAPLTMRQVEEFLLKQSEALGLDAKGQQIDGREADLDKLAAAWREFICAGLNNVHRLDNGKMPDLNGDLWQPDSLMDCLDIVSFDVLRDAILEFSKLKPPAGQSPGEAPAVS